MRNPSLLTVTTLVGTVFLVGHHRRYSNEPIQNEERLGDCCWVQATPASEGVRCMAPDIYRQHKPLTESQKLALGAPIDINRATTDNLEMIPGIGQKRAQNIVEQRKRIGGFSSISDLEKIAGIGAKSLATVTPFLTVKPASCIRKER